MKIQFFNTENVDKKEDHIFIMTIKFKNTTSL